MPVQALTGRLVRWMPAHCSLACWTVSWIILSLQEKHLPVSLRIIVISLDFPSFRRFGLWMSRNSYVSWDVAEDVGRKIRENDIPCDVLHLDTAWFNRDWNCDLKFSEERFPDPGGHMKKLKEDGFHISLWQYNFIPPNEDNANYLEAAQKGYLSKKKDGTPYQLPKNCQGSWVDDVTIDFSNPQAREWYAGKIAALMDARCITPTTPLQLSDRICLI